MQFPVPSKRLVGVAAALLYYMCASIALTMFNKWLFADPSASSELTPFAKRDVGLSPLRALMRTATTSSLEDDPYRDPPIQFVNPLMLSSTTAPDAGKHSWVPQSYGFQFPLTVTAVHQLLVFIIVVILNQTKLLKAQLGEVERSPAAFRTLVPLGIISGLDWGLSNTSLRYVPLSLYEIVKASSPVIVLLLSLVTRTTRPSWRISGIVVLISFGMFLSVAGGDSHPLSATGVPAVGFFCLLVATSLSGIRVVYTQIVLHTGGYGGVCAKATCEPVVPLTTAELLRSTGGTSRSSTQASPRYVVSRVPEAAQQSADGVQLRGAASTVYSAISSMLVEHRRFRSTDSRLDLAELGGHVRDASDDFDEHALKLFSPPPPIASPQLSQSFVDGPPPLLAPHSQRPFNMLTVLFYSAPASAFVLVAPVIVFESSRLGATWGSYSGHTKMTLTALVMVTSVLAFLLAISEFLVTLLTSALTLCIAGIAKQVLIIALAMAVFHDYITLWTAVGFGISMVGIAMYNYDKFSGNTSPTAMTDRALSSDRVLSPLSAASESRESHAVSHATAAPPPTGLH